MKKIIITLCLLVLGLKNYAQTNYLVIQDTRSVNDPPTYFKSRLALDFKENPVIGVANGGYSAVLTVAPWHDYSGGKNHQLSFSDNGVMYRVGNHLAPAWNHGESCWWRTAMAMLELEPPHPHKNSL